MERPIDLSGKDGPKVNELFGAVVKFHAQRVRSNALKRHHAIDGMTHRGFLTSRAQWAAVCDLLVDAASQLKVPSDGVLPKLRPSGVDAGARFLRSVLLVQWYRSPHALDSRRESVAHDERHWLRHTSE